MTAGELLRRELVAVEVNADFTEAIVSLKDGGRLCFHHRVAERRAEVMNHPSSTIIGGQLIAQIKTFRLNAKHLDVQFQDGSRWEARFR